MALQVCWKEFVHTERGLEEVEVCEPPAHRMGMPNDDDDIFPGPGPYPISPETREKLVHLITIVNAAESLPFTVTARVELAELATMSLEATVSELGDGIYLKRTS